MTPLRPNARIADGPVVANATPASARIPPPTIAPTPTLVAPNKPRWRLAAMMRSVDRKEIQSARPDGSERTTALPCSDLAPTNVCSKIWLVNQRGEPGN